MAIAFDNFGSTAVTTTGASFTFTCTSEAVLLMYMGHNAAAASATNVTYNGVPLTKLADANAAGAGRGIEVWGLSAPDAGSYVLSATVNTTGGFILEVVSYTNVRRSLPFGTPASGTATNATNIVFAVSSTTTDVVSYGVLIGNTGNTATLSAGSGTVRGSATAAGAITMVAGDLTGAAQASVSATSSAVMNYRYVAVPLVASVAAVGVPSMCLQGAGF